MKVLNDKVHNYLTVVYRFVFANYIMGAYTNIKSKPHRVNIYEYHPELHDYGKNCRYNNSPYNLGDSLGIPIIQWMLTKKNIDIDKRIVKRKFINCVGSNLFRSFQNLTVWGSGLLCEPTSRSKFLFNYPLTRLDIRAVRGPLTRKILLKYGQKCPEVFGDPAILMPLIYFPKLPKSIDTLVIPQFVSEFDFRKHHPQYEVVSMNTNDYKSVIDKIVSSKLIITSSLHGVILADAYGVPSVLFRALDKEIDFKYLDYYYSTGRYHVSLVDSFEQALESQPLQLPDLSALQQNLIDSFPYDLWG